MITNTLATCAAVIAGGVHRCIESRRYRIEQDDEFYRSLRAYCRTNNLSPICEDDWKTAAADDTDNPSMIHSKGRVS
jgi:hypothetical protein